MKYVTIQAISLIVLSFFNGCKTEPDADAVKKEVLNIHDKLMIDGEKVVKNRIKLDSVLKTGQINPQNSLALAGLISRLNKADENMMDWMHFFKADFKGKTDQQELDYYKSEMIKIRAVEDSYIKVTRQSDSVLKIYDVTPAEKMEVQQHKH